ncbi:MAG: PD-(D/E)XK motif protein [Pseudomonadota bacterium]
MSRIPPEVWARLAGEQPQGEVLWARRAAPDVTDRLVAALDAEGRRHFLVLLLAGEGGLKDAHSRGLEVTTRELTIPQHESGRWLDITCRDASGHEAFDLIGGELAARLISDNAPAPEVVRRVLAKWRRFWGQMARPVLSRQEILGLFGEIWFLSVWLVPRVGVEEAVARWRGPNARHDFEWSRMSVEAKATTSTRGHIHRINGLDQLAPPENGRLMLFSLRLREEGGASNTLPALVATARGLLQEHHDALTHFETMLAERGYLPAHEDDYAVIRLRVVEESVYEVRDTFPRLTPAQFPAGLPTGVERIEYEINLSGCAHLCAARQPDEAGFL